MTLNADAAAPTLENIHILYSSCSRFGNGSSHGISLSSPVNVKKRSDLFLVLMILSKSSDTKSNKVLCKGILYLNHIVLGILHNTVGTNIGTRSFSAS